MSGVEEVLAAHTYVGGIARGVSRCACGVQFHGMEKSYAENEKALAEERDPALLRAEIERTRSRRDV